MPALDRDEALAVGAICARAGTADVIDSSVVASARRRRQAVITSDAEDIRRLDPTIPVVAV